VFLDLEPCIPLTGLGVCSMAGALACTAMGNKGLTQGVCGCTHVEPTSFRQFLGYGHQEQGLRLIQFGVGSTTYV
jgi:hypothetical protein